MENPNYIEIAEEETFGFAEASAKSWPSSEAVVASEGKKAKLSDVVDTRMDIQKKSGIHGHLLETWYESDLAKVAPGKEFMLVRTTVFQCDFDTCVPCFLLIFHQLTGATVFFSFLHTSQNSSIHGLNRVSVGPNYCQRIWIVLTCICFFCMTFVVGDLVNQFLLYPTATSVEVISGNDHKV